VSRAARSASDLTVTPLQLAIFRALADGETANEMSIRLDCSPAYVNAWLGIARKRFGCRTPPALVAFLFRKGILT